MDCRLRNPRYWGFLERAGDARNFDWDELLAVQLLAGTRQLRRLIDNQADVPRLAQLIAELRTYPELERNSPLY